MTTTLPLPETSPVSSPKADLLPALWQIVQDRGLRIGDQLPSIRELSELLDVRPTVVRDAFLEAQGKGFLRILPRAGAFLCRLPENLASLPPNAVQFRTITRHQPNLFHLLDARRLIEIELVGRAAQVRRLEDLLPLRHTLDVMLALPATTTREERIKLDIEFHKEIARLAGNTVLATMQHDLLEQLRPHLHNVPKPLHRHDLVDRSHIAIYEALVNGDAEKARREMHDHLSLAYDGLLRDLQQLPTPPTEGA
ncbi:MAG: FCD domain-containing protein [Planctomycetales bacterium]